MTEDPGPEILRFLCDAGLAAAGDAPRFTALTGGVSSDIWLVETGGARLCVKRACARLRVAADWRVPTGRSAFEARWFARVGSAAPGLVPRLLAFDEALGVLAMEYLAPQDHGLWKARLLAGAVDPAFAGSVGAALGRIHAAFAGDPRSPADFASDAIFDEVRLRPYLVATAEAHRDLAGPLGALRTRTAQTRLTVVHGDVSPKNILVGPAGPVFLDAECAWFGDPAFDLAFCLNHLLLKAVPVPGQADALHAGFAALAGAYLDRVDWERPDALEARAAALLPALLLARIDGKSPVEYITAQAERNLVRDFARPRIRAPGDRLAQLADAWFEGRRT